MLYFPSKTIHFEGLGVPKRSLEGPWGGLGGLLGVLGGPWGPGGSLGGPMAGFTILLYVLANIDRFSKMMLWQPWQAI